MRRFWALARSAALEALAEPLSAILFLIALLAVHLLPVFHLHQFGEPGRLSRECGFSALLMFGLAFATAAAVHSIGRELESGTAAAALARPLFMLAIAGAMLLSVVTAQMGRMATAHGDALSLTWGPGLAAGVGGTLLAFALAALGNWFLRTRFCVGACLLMAAAQPLALVSMLFLNRSPVPWSLLPALGVLAIACAVFVAMAGAFAVCLKPAVVAALLTVVVLLSFVCPLRAVMPDINRFWLVDAFAGGGAAQVADLVSTACAGVLLVAFWFVVGSTLLARREIP